MKFSTLAVALFASTALISVTSAAENGYTEMTDTRGSLEQDCTGCAGGCWMPMSQNPDKCQQTNIFNKGVLLTEADCDILQSFGFATGWCAEAEDIDFSDSEAQSLRTNGSAPNGGQGKPKPIK